MADFQFPNFGVPGFPYQNYVEQLLASLGGGSMPTGVPNQTNLPPSYPPNPQPGIPPNYSPAPVPSAQPPMPTGDASLGGAPMQKPTGNNKMAGGGLLNVTQGVPGIQATTGLTGATGQQFGFTVPQGANGMGQFSFSPTGDQTAVNRQVTFTDANGNPIPGLSSTGIESGQYFNIGPGGNPDYPTLMPGQQYYANLSGGIGPYGAGPANVDYGINFAAGRNPTGQEKMAMARQQFLNRVKTGLS